MRRVYMHFMLTGGRWYCQFLKTDWRTPLRRKLTFADPEKVRELHARFGVDRMLEDRSALDYALELGRGSMWLNLSEEQYRKLL